MSNPFQAPHPKPVSRSFLEDGGCMDDLFVHAALVERVQMNHEWLCFQERTSREIYLAFFRNVDPQECRIREGMIYLNAALWDVGFRTETNTPSRMSFKWKWVGAA
jgi:hypothetical protein